MNTRSYFFKFEKYHENKIYKLLILVVNKTENKAKDYLTKVQFQPGQTQESSHHIQLVVVRQTFYFSFFERN